MSASAYPVCLAVFAEEASAEVAIDDVILDSASKQSTLRSLKFSLAAEGYLKPKTPMQFQLHKLQNNLGSGKKLCEFCSLR